MREYKSACPICRKETCYPANPSYPFCSERCKLIDLRAWLDGSYVIPGEPANLAGEAEGEEEDRPPAGGAEGGESSVDG